MQNKRLGMLLRLSLEIALPICILALLGFGAALWGIGSINSDVRKYQCYAVAFLHGFDALRTLPSQQCSFLSVQSYASSVKWQSILMPFHTLPLEYPMLDLLLFSAPFLLFVLIHLLFTIPAFLLYPVGYAVCTSLVVLTGYVFLRMSTKSLKVVLLYGLLIVLGSWVTALSRFDIVPGVLVLITCICAERGKWKLAYLFLALATLSKFYPIVLLPVLLLYEVEDRNRGRSWNILLRDTWMLLTKNIWMFLKKQNFLVFVALCTIITAISLLANVQATLSPVRYLTHRPVQIESVPASVAWIFGYFQHTDTTVVYTFGSYNVVNSFTPTLGNYATGCMLLGLIALYIGQLTKSFHFDETLVCILLLVLLTGKVFSPQYLLWVTPLFVYVYRSQYIPLFLWGCVCMLTTIVYPFAYAHYPGNRADILPFSTARNGFLCITFLYCILPLFTRAWKTVQVINEL